MDYSNKTIKELISICKDKKLKGYTGKKKSDIIFIINQNIQDTGKFRTNLKDQFYTDKIVAQKCFNIIISLIQNPYNYLWIEPSAGSGSFFHILPSSFDKIGIDLDPKSADILKEDFLQWSFPITDKKIIVFGNPPFGKQSSLAKSFIKKSCKFASFIAFILPKSFMKPSMFNVFDLKFHCIYSKELDKDSFIINETKYDVPCIFQIWEKK